MSTPFTLGKPVIDGVLRYWSPSSVKTFDPNEGGCNRQWWLRYVAGIRQPTTPAQQVGIDGHARIEHYLRTGENVLTAMDLAGQVWIPKPGEVAAIEQRAEPGKGSPIVAGVPGVSVIDCLLAADGYYVDPQGEVHAEEFPEVLDWKYSSNPTRYGKTASEIGDDIAMSVYGLWAIDWLNIHHKKVRLSHVYFSTRGRPCAFKRSAVVPVDRLRARLERAAPVIEEMKVCASVKSVEEVAANLNACDNYGGCYYGKNNQCPRSTDDLMRSLFPTTTEEQTPMALLDSLKPQPTAAAPMGDRLAALKAEEEAATAQVSNLDPAVAAALESIAASGYGAPMFTDEAATLVAEFKNFELSPGAGLAGSGRLAPITIRTADQIIELARELSGMPPVEAAAPPAPEPSAAPPINPPDASPLSAATAAVPVEPAATLDLAPAIQKAATAQMEASQAPPPEAPAPAAPPAPPKSPGRPSTRSAWSKMKKPELVAELERRDAAGESAAPIDKSVNVKLSAEVDALRAARDALSEENAALRASAQGGPASAPVEVWIDCLPVGIATESLDGFVMATVDLIAEKAGVPHILAAGEKSPLAFGKWEGYLTQAVREASIPAGRYHLLHVKGDRVREVFAAALSTVAKTNRGV